MYALHTGLHDALELTCRVCELTLLVIGQAGSCDIQQPVHVNCSVQTYAWLA